MGHAPAACTLKVVDSCWAACLGDCSNKLTREHLVSSALFIGDVVRVQGFPWCRENPIDIGITALTAKVLCKRHNSALSPIDDAGAKAFAVLREIRRLANVRERMKPRPWNVVRYRIDGPSLERWFLKTLINLCCERDYPVGRESAVVGRPSEGLVRIAYGLESFKGRAGLYFVVRTGMRVESADNVGFAPLIKPGFHIEGGLFSFRGQPFLLFLEPGGPPEPLDGIYISGEDLGAAHLNFHNEKILVKTGKYLSQVLTIDWQGHLQRPILKQSGRPYNRASMWT